MTGDDVEGRFDSFSSSPRHRAEGVGGGSNLPTAPGGGGGGGGDGDAANGETLGAGTDDEAEVKKSRKISV